MNLKPILLCISCVLTLTAFQGQSLDLKVGERLPSALIPEEPDFIAMPDLLPVAEVNIKGISYEVAYSGKTRIIKHIFTEDEGFVTDDGLRVGMCVAVSREQIDSVRGGLTRGPATSDGWTPVIGYRSHVTKCEQDAQKSPLTSHVDKLPSKADGTKVEVRIIKFMK